MSVQIVHNQYDLFGFGIVDIYQFLDASGKIYACPLIRNTHVAPRFQQREHHTQVDDAIALVVIIHTFWLPGLAAMEGRVSSVSCRFVSSIQTKGRLGS